MQAPDFDKAFKIGLIGAIVAAAAAGAAIALALVHLANHFAIAIHWP